MVPGRSRSCRLQRGQLTAQMLTVLFPVDRWPPERPHAPWENISCDSTHRAFLAGESRAPLNYLCFDVIRLSPGENPKYCVGFGGLVGAQKQVCDITQPITIQSQSNLERMTECRFQSLFLSVNNPF